MSTQHLSADTLADLQEGLLDRSAADEAAAHLHGCAQCRTDRRALDQAEDGIRDDYPLPAAFCIDEERSRNG